VRDNGTVMRHYLGAFLVELGGLDALTFSDRIARTVRRSVRPSAAMVIPAEEERIVAGAVAELLSASRATA
jgi:hypothetical protein